ncbi:MAG: hypothetical protein IPJ69_02870 [Deltaproteobacteria bacterium]|nr:MAG: hypothetical protein IPJ69_02870 [Deltaproteobacteria bacterium]
MKLKLSILVISFLSVFINSTSNASSDFMTLALKPHVVVNREADSKVLTLGDLIEVEKTSPQIVQRYSGVSLEGVSGGTLQASHVLAVLKKKVLIWIKWL